MTAPTTEAVAKKSCPFCGHADTEEPFPHKDGFRIECDKCYANLFARPMGGDISVCKARLIERWNTRSAPEPCAQPDGYYVFRTEGSHDQAMWWRPNSRGYTFNLKEAGVYTKAQADEIDAGSHGEDWGVPVSDIDSMAPMTMIDGYRVKQWRKQSLTKGTQHG
jgi:hypothetical protein